MNIIKKTLFRAVPFLKKLSLLAEAIDEIKVDEKGNTYIKYKNNVILDTPTNFAINTKGVFYCDYSVGVFGPEYKTKEPMIDIHTSLKNIEYSSAMCLKLDAEYKNKLDYTSNNTLTESCSCSDK